MHGGTSGIDGLFQDEHMRQKLMNQVTVVPHGLRRQAAVGKAMPKQLGSPKTCRSSSQAPVTERYISAYLALQYSLQLTHSSKDITVQLCLDSASNYTEIQLGLVSVLGIL